MNSSRITSDDTSRLSMSIGLGVGLIFVGLIVYFVVSGYMKTKEVVGFDPNRPVPTDAVLRARLKPEQYRITRENGTETPFKNDFWNNDRAGIYADVITGEPLFTSLDKFDNSTGQLTFTKPISYDLIVEKQDLSYNMQRVEVRAKRSDAHLGHLFGDPTSPTGRRYSVNSAAFRFIPVERMEVQGYGQWVTLLGPRK
ncbi:MAG: peptide-methionine (R)-S-oxide reductase MsrB [Verrucomicrobiota bacterium]